MPIKNYTTSVSASRTVNEIQDLLRHHGASDVIVHYGTDREPENLTFNIETKHGDIVFRLPANVPALAALLLKQLTASNYRQWDTQYQAQRKAKVKEQAGRVAWRIIKDWVDAQLAIIETEMVTLEEVFLPYMVTNDGRILYEALKGKDFFLTEGKPA